MAQSPDGDFWGGGYYTRKIAQFLGPEYPFYDLRSHGLRDGRIPPVEAMAQRLERTQTWVWQMLFRLRAQLRQCVEGKLARAQS